MKKLRCKNFFFSNLVIDWQTKTKFGWKGRKEFAKKIWPFFEPFWSHSTQPTRG